MSVCVCVCAQAEFAPTDVLAVVGALTLSTGSLLTGNYTLNNLMACLIASDILQLVSPYGRAHTHTHTHTLMGP